MATRYAIGRLPGGVGAWPGINLALTVWRPRNSSPPQARRRRGPDGAPGTGGADGFQPGSDRDKAAGLRRMKLLALSLLVLFAVIFTVSFALQRQYPWLEYVRAASEGRHGGRTG